MPAPALSTFVVSPESQEAVDKWREAQQKLIDAYENRNQRFDPTWLAIAQALGSPTRTGKFGEVLGNIAASLGPVQEAEGRRAQELAKMRMEMAQFDIQQAQQNEGMRMAKGLLAPSSSGAPAGAAGAPGTPSGAAAPGGAPSGGGLQNLSGTQIAAIKMMPGMKTVGEALESGVKLDRDRFKVENNVVVDMGAPGGPKVLLDLRGGEQKPTEIVVDGKRMVINMSPPEEFAFRQAAAQGNGAEFFEKNLKGRRTDVDLPATGGELREIEIPMLGGLKIRGTPRQAANIERLQEEAAATGNATELKRYVNNLTGASLRSESGQRAPQAGAGSQAALGITSDLSELPLKEQNEEIVKRLSAADKPAQEQQALLMKNASPDVTVASNRRLKELTDLVSKNPKVVGLMNEQGLLAALGRAAQEGARVGQYSVSLPVNEFLQNLKLSREQQQTARRIAQLLDEEFFNRANLSKSALGPQISNADVMLMKSPVARPEDAAPLIKYWAMHGILTNKQLDEMYGGLNAWQDQTKGKAPARQFFNTEGRRIMNKYTPLYEQLQSTFAPR